VVSVTRSFIIKYGGVSKVLIFCEVVERGVSQLESSLDKTYFSVL
jgi:hypothetical protein